LKKNVAEKEEASDDEDGGSSSQKNKKKIKKVPQLLLANKFDLSIDPTGYWISEKLDGVRAYWDKKDFWSRNGNKFSVPDIIKKFMPSDHCLDGEMWLGRQQFQKCVGVVRSSNIHNKIWPEITYQIFDIPSLDKPFEERIEFLKELFKNCKSSNIVVVEHKKCEDQMELKRQLEVTEKIGGEGLMLRQPKSKYVGSRSDTLLKVKSFFDTEAKVLKHEPGKGKFAGMCGALLCELPDKTTFAVGSGLTLKDRKNPPKIGAIITFRYMETSEGGVPRFPTYLGERIDVDWPPKNFQLPHLKQKFDNKNPKKEILKAQKGENFLSGKSFTITGTHSIVRREMVELIESAGGRVAAISKKIDYLLSTENQVEIDSGKVSKAKKCGVAIVTEDFLFDCMQNKKVVDHKKYIINC